MGFRVLALNSEKGVKTPSWRIMGIKNDPHYSEQINCSGFVYLASLVQLFFYIRGGIWIVRNN